MRRLVIVLTAALLAAACGDDDDGAVTTTTSAPTTTTSTTAADEEATTTEPEAVSLLPLGEGEVIVSELRVPWALAFIDEDTFLFTERPGVVRAVEDGVARRAPVLELDVVARGEGGALGLALHPDFPEQRHAFVYYTTTQDNRVSRFEVADDLTLSGEEVLLDGIPVAAIHDGGRIAFGPDDHLYITTGDAAEPSIAADLDSLGGKILRIAADGSVPDDNPFDGSPVWSYGHRNPQGLAWSADGTMYATEHGPSGELGLCCNDELNRIEPGGFYGWPFRAGEVEAMQGEPPAEPILPIATSGNDDTWAPSGLALVTGPDGGDVLLVAGLRGSALLRFDIVDGTAQPAGVALEGEGRLRIATVGPGGCLFVGTSNQDGRGDPRPDDDRILRFC